MRISALLLLSICASFTLSAQTSILDIKEKDDESVPSRFGKRSKHFIESNLGFGGFFVPAEQGPDVKIMGSNESTFGFRYRRLIRPRFAIGTEFNFRSEVFQIADDQGVFAGNVLGGVPVDNTEKRSFTTNALESSVFLRLLNSENLRGRLVMVDFAYVFGYRYKIQYKETASSMLEEDVNMESTYTNLEEFTPFYHAGEVRFTVNRLSLYSRYRLNTFLNTDSDSQGGVLSFQEGDDLPPLSFGFKINLY